MGLNIFDVNTHDFQTQVLNSATPVLVDFWAEWCPPCKMLDSIVNDIAQEYKDILRVAKLDADLNQEVIMKYGVMGLPTLILFKDGEAVERITGFKPKSKIVNTVIPHI